MKRTTLLYLTAGLLAFGSTTLLADTTTNEPPATTHHEGKHGGGNKEFLHAIGLTQSDLKGLSKEDRRSKIQSSAEAAETALKQKETAGTITDSEKTDLALIEKHLAHGKKKADQ
jgi:hypothetical protein